MSCRSGRQSEAVGFYKQALEMDSSNAEAWTALGAAHANLNDLTRAVSCFHKALGEDPEL